MKKICRNLCIAAPQQVVPKLPCVIALLASDSHCQLSLVLSYDVRIGEACPHELAGSVQASKRPNSVAFHDASGMHHPRP